LAIGLIDYFSEWRPIAPLLARSTIPADSLRLALRKLVRSSLLHRSDRRLPPAERKMEQWDEWNPAAGFFHFSTKDVPYQADDTEAVAFLKRRLIARSIPAETKQYGKRVGVRLPRIPTNDAFSRVLLARRSWRKFGHELLSMRALSALMQLTFGAQKFIDLGAIGRAMLRTSPSAGARNPIEAYVAVRRVSGLRPGLYHYSPIEHRLVRLRKVSSRTIQDYACGQTWCAQASVLVFMTAVFARTGWKYPTARAYRAVLLEAGHFCQTFCLVATALGLAPFCTAALADSIIERDLGLDGVSESVIYACGVGPRPSGVAWTPWSDPSPR
jgi:SagB-type dehydrogenase family enzyme